MSLEFLSQDALLGFTDRLEAEALALPRWDPGSPEPWSEFVDRQYEAETNLARQLRALPACELEMSSTRATVTLTLLGLQVRSHQGLAEACRLWAAAMRAQLVGNAPPGESDAKTPRLPPSPASE